MNGGIERMSLRRNSGNSAGAGGEIGGGEEGLNMK